MKKWRAKMSNRIEEAKKRVAELEKENQTYTSSRIEEAKKRVAELENKFRFKNTSFISETPKETQKASTTPTFQTLEEAQKYVEELNKPKISLNLPENQLEKSEIANPMIQQVKEQARLDAEKSKIQEQAWDNALKELGYTQEEIRGDVNKIQEVYKQQMVELAKLDYDPNKYNYSIFKANVAGQKAMTDLITTKTANMTFEEYENYIYKEYKKIEKYKKYKSQAYKNGNWEVVGQYEVLIQNAQFAEELKKMEEKYDDSTFFANYNLGQMQIEYNNAMNRYFTTDNEQDFMKAEQIRKKIQYYTQRAEKAGKGNWITKDFAEYAPQMVSQLQYGITGAFGGAVAGGTVGSVIPVVGTAGGAVKGAGAGYVGGVATFSYNQMRGAAYSELLELGVPPDIAKAVAKDTALWQSIIEGAGAGADLLLLGVGKLFSKGTKTAAQLTAKKMIVNALKAYGWNLVTETTEEATQEMVAIKQEEKALEMAGIKDIRTDAEKRSRIIEAGFGGFKIALISGAGKAIGNITVSAINNTTLKQTDAFYDEYIEEVKQSDLSEKEKTAMIKDAEEGREIAKAAIQEAIETNKPITNTQVTEKVQKTPEIVENLPKNEKISQESIQNVSNLQETEELVETNIGKIPVAEYRDIMAQQAGFDDYADMRKNGIKLGNKYDIEDNQKTETEATQIVDKSKILVSENTLKETEKIVKEHFETNDSAADAITRIETLLENDNGVDTEIVFGHPKSEAIHEKAIELYNNATQKETTDTVSEPSQQTVDGELTIDDKIKGLKVELDYAEMKYKEHAKALNYTEKAREGFEQWDKERKRLQKELKKLENSKTKKTTKEEKPTKGLKTKETAEKIDDFGEKIGGARKDLWNGTKKHSTREVVHNYTINRDVVETDDGGTKETYSVAFKGSVLKDDFKSEEEAQKFIEEFKTNINNNRAKVEEGYARDKEGNKITKYIITITDPKTLRSRDTGKSFNTRAEAESFAMALSMYLAEHGKNLFRPHIQKVTRINPEYKNSIKATGQQILDTFKFRGGEFGNWVNNEERQKFLNYGYDALTDLAIALDVLPSDLGFGGKMAVAFGARGQGFSDANAHFEPVKKVFNMTKLKGAGSAAHEMGHALDNFLSQLSGYDVNGMLSVDQRYRNLPESVTQAFRDLLDNIQYSLSTNEEEIAKKNLLFEKNRKETLQYHLNYYDKVFKGEATKYVRKKGEYKNVPIEVTAEQKKEYNKIKEILMEGKLKDTRDFAQGKSRFSLITIYDKPLEDLKKLIKTVTNRKIDDDTVYSLYRNGIPSKQISEIRSESAFSKAARELDKLMGRASVYHALKEEMLARSFETFVFDELKKKGITNDYLVHSVYNDRYSLFNPYPAGEERAAMNKSWRKLINAMKEEGIFHDADSKAEVIKHDIKPLKKDFKTYEDYASEDAALFNAILDQLDRTEIAETQWDLMVQEYGEEALDMDWQDELGEFEEKALEIVFDKYVDSPEGIKFVNDFRKTINITDNQGRRLSKGQQEYFKDSKVRDEEKNLLTMYHGTKDTFTVFEHNHKKYDSGFWGEGFYFTNNKETANNYSKWKQGNNTFEPKVMEVYLDVKKPLVINEVKISAKHTISKALNVDIDVENYSRVTREESKKITEALVRQGYDGIIYKNVDGNINVVVVNSNQIKDVDNINPTSDSDIKRDMRIEKQNAPEIKPEKKAIVPSPEVKKILNTVGIKDEEIYDPANAYVQNLLETLEEDREYFGKTLRELDIENVEYGNKRTNTILNKRRYDVQTGKVQANPNYKDGASLGAIRREIEKYLGKKIGLKGYRGSSYGIYKTGLDSIRVKDLSNIESTLHELGHRTVLKELEKGLEGAPQEELDQLAERAFGIAYDGDPSEKLEEGWAEFVRRFVTNNKETIKEYPELSRFMEEEMTKNKKIEGVITSLIELSEQYVNAPTEAQIRQMQSIGEDTGKTADRNFFDKYMYEIHDELWDIKQMTKSFAKGLKTNYWKLEPTDNVYNLMRSLKANEDRVLNVMKFGLIDDNGVRRTKGMSEIMEKISNNAENIQKVRDLLIALRTLDYSAVKMETGLAPAEALKLISKYSKEKDVFNAANEIIKFQDEIMDYAVQKGLMKQEEYEEMKKWNKLYIPLKRVFEGKENSSGSKMGASKLIKRRTGSAREIIDPFESIIQNTAMILTKINQNEIMKTLADLQERTQIATFFEQVDPGQKLKAEVSLDLFKNVLEEEGVDTDEIDLDVVKRIFSPIMNDDKTMTIGYMDKGKLKALEFKEKYIYEVITGSNNGVISNANLVLSTLDKFTGLLRMGATTGNLEFAIPNMISDTMTAWMFSESGFIPAVDTIRGLYDYLIANYEWADALTLDTKYKQNNKYLYDLYKQSGATMATRVASYRPEVQEYVLEVFGKHANDLASNDMNKSKKAAKAILNGLLKAPQKLQDVLSIIPELSEQATRFESFKKDYNYFRNKKGYNHKNALLQASINTRDITMDFNRMGHSMRVYNRIKAFSAARAQGIYRFIEGVEKMPAKVLGKLGILGGIALSMLILADAMDNDKEEEITDQKRKDNFIIPLGSDGDIVTIKKPQGTARSFINFIELMYNVGNGKIAEEDYDKEWGNWIKDTVAENSPIQLDLKEGNDFFSIVAGAVLPTSTEAIIENALNRDFYYGNSIVPTGRENLRPEDQYNENTSQTAILIGKALNQSPAKVENLITGWFAGVGQQALDLSDYALGKISDDIPEAPSKTKDQAFISKRFFVSGYRNSESVSQVYEQLEKLNQLKEYDEATEEQLEQLEKMKTAQKAMSQINKDIKSVQNSLTMSGDEKRDKILELQELRTDTARYYLGKELINESNKEEVELYEYYPASSSYVYSVNKKIKVTVNYTEADKKEYAELAKEIYEEELKDLKKKRSYREATEEEKKQKEESILKSAKSEAQEKISKKVYERDR